jgi:hypothetical protein
VPVGLEERKSGWVGGCGCGPMRPGFRAGGWVCLWADKNGIEGRRVAVPIRIGFRP